MLRLLPLSALCLLVGMSIGCNDATEMQRGNGAARAVNTAMQCQGPADCGADELCVVDPHDPFASSCMQRCSVTHGDVCPVGEHCAPVVGVEAGERAAACIPGATPSQKSWQSCNDQLDCGDGESCLYLDAKLKARCVPACNPDDSCRRSSEACILHWDGDRRASSGCAHSCEIDADCESGWHCAQGESIQGLCVR